jgi:Ras family protein T1
MIFFCSLKAPPNCSIELSLQCFEFLQYLFKKHDRDNDGCLNRSELADFFASCPITNPWGRDVHNTVETNLNGEITLCGFLSQWV